MIDQLSELSDDQIVELQSEIVGEFEAVEGEEPTPQTVEAMTSLADMLDSVRNEVKRREVLAVELTQQATEAAARVRGDETAVAEEAPAEEAPAEEEAPAPESEAATEQPKETNMDETTPVAPEEPVAPTEEPTADAAPAADAPQVEAETPEENKKEDGKEEPIKASATELSADDTSTSVESGSELTTEETVELSTEPIETPETLDVPEAQEENVEATVTAAIDGTQDITPEVPADRRLTSDASAIPVAITAGADIPGVTAGTTLNSMTDVADAMSKRLHGLRRVNGGDGEQHIVASFSTAYPDSLQLGSDAEANMAKIEAVTSTQALVASGGYQSPYATKYDIFGIGTNARPVRDCLPSFQADRGGIRYITPPSLGTNYQNAVGIWTQTLDTTYVTNSATSSATKQNLVVTAASEVTAVADAVTLQMQFGNLATRAYPELIARHNELGLIQHAREAEENLLAGLSASSTAVTSVNTLGTGVDFLLQVGRAAAQYRGRHRMDAEAVLRVVAPYWVKSAIRADFALQAPGDDKIAVSDADIEAWLKVRGVNICWYLDDSNIYAAQTASTMLTFPNTAVWYIFAEGTFLFLDGGTLDLGVIRDSTLVGTNDYKMFVETFEGVAKVGVESIKVTSTMYVNGARAALRDTITNSAGISVGAADF
jgi:hypothetical protein